MGTEIKIVKGDITNIELICESRQHLTFTFRGYVLGYSDKY